MDLFKQFDIVNDVGDHHYAKLRRGEIYAPSEVKKRIMQEWKILENNLPETINVRAYKGRVDLLRACIIGTAGPPYQDSLFFFDLKFPANYPAQPPKVHYKAYRIRAPPQNLYQWRVHINGAWNSKVFTVLQVLVSIQNSVINGKPYSLYHKNCPGTCHWCKKLYLEYKRSYFLESCIVMIHILNKPPMHFEEFVSLHFHERAQAILTAWKVYIDGFGKFDMFLMEDILVRTHEKLLLALLIESASPLGKFVKQLKLEGKTSSSQPQQVGKIKGGFTKETFTLVNKMWLKLKKPKKFTTKEEEKGLLEPLLADFLQDLS